LWVGFLTWIRDNQIGDLAGITGIFISIIGFIATLVGVTKSKSAARSAEEAAKRTRESVRSLDAILDFSATISALEEIKRLQRQNAWTLLPERYAAARKLLILFRESGVILSDVEKSSWPAPGSEDTELGVLMEPEVDHGETEVYERVQA
jgi:hypothetical protein